MPEFLRRNPMFVQTAFEFPVAARGNDMWGASEFSQSLFRWRRGTMVAAEELKLPVVRRRGVDTEVYLQALRDPAKGAALIYNHSIPMALRFITPDILALLTFDPKFDKGVFTGPHHLTLVDTRTRKVCPDVPLPIPSDPQPKVAITGDTLVVLQQASDGNDEVVSALRRFRIDPTQCVWVAL